MTAKERTKENCRCCGCSGPRLRGCTPLRTPKRRSEGAGAKRKQYYFSFLTPPPLPPLLSREFPRTPAGGRGRPPCQRGSGLGDSDGPYVAARSRSATRQLGRGGLSPSLAPLVRNPFTAVRRGRACPARSLAIVSPLAVCIVGRGLDPSVTSRQIPSTFRL